MFKRPKYDVTDKDSSGNQEALNSELRMAVRYAAPTNHMFRLISRGAHVNCTDSLSLTPILIALSATASAHTADMVSSLCELGADVNYTSDVLYGDTSLHFAAGKGNSEVISILLRYKANVHARNYAGRTPLHVAAFHGNEATVRTLYLGGARLDAKEYYCGYSPLHLAVIGSCNATIDALLECGASIMQLDACGLTSIQRCQSQKIKRLLRVALSRLPTLEHLCLHVIRESVRKTVGFEGFQHLALPFTLEKKLRFTSNQ